MKTRVHRSATNTTKDKQKLTLRYPSFSSIIKALPRRLATSLQVFAFGLGKSQRLHERQRHFKRSIRHKWRRNKQQPDSQIHY